MFIFILFYYYTLLYNANNIKNIISVMLYNIYNEWAPPQIL